MNLAAVSGIRGVPETGVWFRAVDPRHLATALATAHTPGIRSRFWPGAGAARPFATLYLAENPTVALFEVQSLFGTPLVPGGTATRPEPRCPSR